MNENIQKRVDPTGKRKNLGKREKFIELAEKRTIKAIQAIRILAKLGNKSHYEYDESDVKKIVSALNKEVESLKVRMLTAKTQDKVEFKL